MFAISINPLDWLGDAVDSAASAAFDFLVEWVVSACDWLAKQLATVLIGAGKPDWDSAAFGPGGAASNLMYLAMAVLIGGGMLQLISTQWNPQSSITDSLIELPTTAVAVGSVYLIANMVLGVTDALGHALFADGIFQALQSGFKPGSMIVPFLRVLIAVVMVFLLLLLFIEQLVRAHLLAVVIVLLPLAVAGRAWAPAKYLSGAMMKIFIALAMTPVVAGVSMSIALSNYSAAAGELDLTQALQGIAGLLVTTLMPFLVFKLFPIGADGGGGVGLAAGAAAYGAGSKLAKGFGASGGGGGGGAGGGASFGAAQRAMTSSSTGGTGGGVGVESSGSSSGAARAATSGSSAGSRAATGSGGQSSREGGQASGGANGSSATSGSGTTRTSPQASTSPLPPPTPSKPSTPGGQTPNEGSSGYGAAASSTLNGDVS